MLFGERSDAELVDLAQRGWAPAFAVLLHRHGPAVRAAVADDPDPTGAVIEVFVTAMRRLPSRDPDEPVRPWLLELAGDAPTDDEAVPPLSEEELDEIWAELDVRWPKGRPPVHVPRPVRLAGLVTVLVALSALLPTLLLADEADEEALEELGAFPLEEEVEEPEAAEEPEELEFDLDQLPTFDLDEEEPPPAPEAAPEPAPAPDPEPEPEPEEPEPESEEPEEPADDGPDEADRDDEPLAEDDQPEAGAGDETGQDDA